MISKTELLRLYSKGMSMSEIAKSLHCSTNTVVYWMRTFNIKRRSHSEATYLKANPNGDPFKIKTELNDEERFLLGLGLGIYWGEGTKVDRTSLRVSNSDPALIKSFIAFMTNICQLDVKRFSYSLLCFNDANPEIARRYWSQKLGVLPEKFGKITLIPSRGKGTYKRKSKYGVCIVQGNNVKLKAWIMTELANLGLKYA